MSKEQELGIAIADWVNDVHYDGDEEKSKPFWLTVDALLNDVSFGPFYLPKYADDAEHSFTFEGIEVNVFGWGQGESVGTFYGSDLHDQLKEKVEGILEGIPKYYFPDWGGWVPGPLEQSYWGEVHDDDIIERLEAEEDKDGIIEFDTQYEWDEVNRRWLEFHQKDYDDYEPYYEVDTHTALKHIFGNSYGDIFR